jgi:dihydrofolate synthase/folylpolyglutamate synthase
MYNGAMPEIKSFEDVHKILERFIPESRSRREAYTLDRIGSLMEFLGNPQNTYKVVHVAGTSGKTSTCYYLSALLKASGQKVGLMVSPHVDEINERLQINGKPLAEKKFCQEFSIFLNAVTKSGITPTYFEILVAFAFWEFARQKVDYAVVEVGLGGLLDGTNVIKRKDKVCIITDIGLDHTEVLGKTITAIAAQKAGIIHPYNVVFCYEQGDEVMNVLREVCEQQQAELHEVWPLKNSELPAGLPLFQRRNWYLALQTFNNIVARDNLPGLTENGIAKTTKTYIPARMEIVNYKDKIMILDGAHNSQKLHALMASVTKEFKGQPINALIAFKGSKQVNMRNNLQEILPHCANLFITNFVIEKTELFSVDPLKLVEHSEALEYHNWKVVPDPVKAFRELLKRKEPVILVTGSFYLLNYIRPLILKTDD